MNISRNGPEDRNRDNRDNDHNEDNHGEYGEDRPTGMDPEGVIEVRIESHFRLTFI